MRRRIVSLVMAVVMVLSMLPTAAWAELVPELNEALAEENTVPGGEQGEDVQPEQENQDSEGGEDGENGVALLSNGAVAEADGRTFDTLQAAFDYATNEAPGFPTIKLLENVTLDECIYPDSGVTLDLNGKTVSRAPKEYTMGGNDASVFCVQSGGRLTIKDTAGGGQIVQPNIYAAVTANGGTVTIEGGTIKATSEDAENNRAIEVSSGTVTINGGAIEGAQIGVRVWGGARLTVTGGTIRGGESYALLTSGTVELSGGTFITNASNNYSIWNEKGTAESLLASAGYAYTTEAGERSAFSDDGRGVVGNTTVEEIPESVSYIGADGTVQSCAEYEVVTSDTDGLSDRWYVVKEDASVWTLYLNGYNSTTNLILCDGATLKATNINATGATGVTLNIYLQSGGTGKLVCEGGIDVPDELAAINRVGTPMKLVGRNGKATSDLTSFFEISKCGHDGFTYDQKNATTHTGTCAYCGTELSGKHDYTWAYKDADTHTGTCTVCGYESAVAHEMRYTDNHDGLTHKSFCRDCDLTHVAEKHRFQYITYGKCVDCGAVPVASVKSGENVACYTTLENAFQKADDNSTITLLADVQLDPPLSIEADDSNGYRDYLTLDLNGKTISCENWKYNYTVYSGITLTICDSSEEQTGVITHSGENNYAVWGGGMGRLTITGGTFGKVGIFGDGAISGGTFSAIWVFDFLSNPEKLNTVLKDGYAFANSDGSIVNGYENTSAANVTVVEHKTHTYDTTGKCACGAECPHEQWKDGKCAACGYACTHDKGVDADVNCKTCGLAIAAEVKAGGKTTYHADIATALEAAKDNGTLKVIAKEQTVALPATQTGYPVLYAEGTLTIDLNGHTLNGGGLMLGGYISGFTTRPGNLTVIDSAGGGKITGDMYGLKVQPGANVKFDGAATTACSKLAVFSNVNQPGQIKFTGGVINGITQISGAACADLLAEGYCFYSYDEATSTVGEAIELSTLDGQTKVTTPLAVGKCSHDKAGDDGKCVYCGAKLAVRDNNGVIYGSLTEAISAALSDSSIKWLQLDANMTESVVFDAEGKSVTVKMNGKTLTSADGVPLTVKNGTLTIEGAANITQNGAASDAINYAVHVTGGKLVFAGDLTATGGVFSNGNVPQQKSAIYAEGGELDFRGNITLKGSLDVTGSAKLTNGLTQGTFSAEDGSNANRISVEDSENYKCLNALLAEGCAFAETDDQSKYPCTATNMRSWSGNVTIVSHTHTWGQGTGDYFWCTVCHLVCEHPGGFASGACAVCGMPCPHASLDDTGSGFRCRACNQIMVARSITKNNEGYDLTNYYASLVDALKAVKNGETVTLLSDVDNSGKYAILTGDDKTATLDLNGKTVTSGWIVVGMDRDRKQYTSSTLKVVGSGSITGYVNIGYFATADLSGWTGGTIRYVDVSNDGSAGVDGKLIVGENAGTIENLAFYNRRTASISSELSGGTYGSITISISDYKVGNIPYSDMLAEGYAFRYVDSDEYVPYGKKAEYGGVNTINNVKVVKCPHTPETVTGKDGRCACGQVQYQAQITRDGTTTLYQTLTDAVAALVDGDTLTLLSHVSVAAADGAGEGLTIDKSITFDLNGKTLSSSATNMLNGILRIKGGTVTVKNGTVKASGIGTSAIRADSETILENVTTAIVYSGLGSVAACAPVTIKSGDYQGLYVSEGRRAVLEGGTFRPCNYTSTTGENVNSIYWKVNANNSVTSRDCMELLAEGYGYVDANDQPVRTFGGFRETVTVKKGAAVTDPVAKIGETEYTGLHSAMKAAKSGETVTLLTDLELGNGAVLLLSDITADFTIDLGGHTLSADGSFLVHMYENSRHVTLKNGTLDGSKCTGSAGAILIATRYGRGELTLENVTAKSGTMTDWMGKVVPVPVVKVTSGTAVFNGGSYTGGVLISNGNMVLNSGTFYKGENTYGIQTKVSGKNLADYLGEDSVFWASANKEAIIDLSSVTSVGDTVVDLCDHNWVNGTCTVCKRVCGHQEPVDGKCPRCGLSMVASVDGKFFPDFASALEAVKAAKSCTMKLYTNLAYGESAMNSNTLGYTKLTVDLNGYELYGADGTSRGIYVMDGAELVIQDTSADKNGSVDNVQITTSTTGGKLTLMSGAIDALQTDPSSTVTLKVGAKVRYLTTGSGQYRFPVAALVPGICGLVDEGGNWADLSQPSVGSVTGTGYYTVTSKDGSLALSGGSTVETPCGSKTVPSAVKVAPWPNKPWDAAKVRFQWYRTDGMYDVLTDYTCTEPVNQWGEFDYDTATVGTGSGWADMTVGTSVPLTCVISGLDKDNTVLWCISSVKYTLTVGKGDLSAAEIDFPYGSSVTFNGDPNTNYREGSNSAPYCTVTLYGKTLVKDTDYTVVSGNTATAVGDYTLTLEGAGDYTGTKTAEWHVTPAELKDPWVGGVTEKAYDGTDTLPAGRVFSEFSTTGAGGFRVYLTEGTDFTISDAHYDTADVGEQKTIHFTVTLLNGNYTFDGGKTVKEFAVPGSDFTITKAAAPTNIRNGALNVINGTKLEYTYDATQLLPDAPEGDYGRVTYDCVFPFDLENGYSVGVNDIGIRRGVLTLTIDALSGEKTGKIGTITVRVPTRNYEKFDLLIDLYAVDKITPVLDGDVTASEITYGDELSKSTISGKVKDSDTGDEVKGTFAWTDGTIKPSAGGYEAEWTFTPATGYEEYATATGKVTVKVNKAAAACTAPTANTLTYNGAAQALIAAGSTADGEMQYSLTENGAYSTAIPTGTDAGTYTVWYRVIGDENHNDTAARSVTVALKRLDIADAEIALGSSLTYTGKEQIQSITSVTVDGLTVTYDVTSNTGTDAKTYTMTLTGTGNFTGTVTKDFTIAPKNIAGAKIVLGDSLTYTGKEQTQSITSVTVDGLDVDYTVTGNTGTDAKTYTMTLTGTGNFIGTASKNFTIARKSIANAEIVLGEALTYNGKEQTKGIVSARVDGLTVTYDVTGDKQTDAGDYTLTVIGTGNFTGSKTQDFTIARKDMSKAVITLGDSLTYNGQSQTQSITSVTVDGLTVTYDPSGDTATNAGSYTLTVTGTGNFIGTVTKDFAIARKDIRDAVVDMNAPAYNGKVQTPVISAARVDSMVLAEGTDYTAVLKDAVSAGSYSVQLTGTGNFTGTAERKFVIGKAAAPAVMPIRMDVTNDYAANYTVDLRAALNAVLPKGCSFGTVQYGAAQYSDAAGYCDAAKSGTSGQGILTLAVNKVSRDTEGHAATVTVTVTTGNYQDITVTVELYAVNKAVPTGTPSLSRNRLSYGETLSAIRMWGSMRSGNAWVSGTFTWAEPNLRPESGTYKAEWVFTPTDDKYASVTGTVDITVAEPPATVPTYRVGGIVKGFSVTGGTPGGVISDAAVTIRKGLEVLGGQKITDKDGIFDLNGVTAGVYNVVVEYRGKTVTTKVEIVDHDVQLEVLIPVEDVNSQLEIKNPTALTDNVVVGGLDQEAGKQFSEGGTLPGGGYVSVSMDIQEKTADRNDDAQNAIRKELAGKSLQFISMDMTLVKNGVEQPLTETSTVLEIILSYDTGRRNIMLARHTVNDEGEDAAEELKPKDTGENGTFYIDEANKCIHIFTNRMSTYAIGYTSYSGGSSQPVKSAETGDIGLLPYAAMTLSACTGVVVLRFRRKRED